MSQDINYLGIENGGKKITCSSIWLMSSSAGALVMGAFLIM